MGDALLDAVFEDSERVRAEAANVDAVRPQDVAIHFDQVDVRAKDRRRLSHPLFRRMVCAAALLPLYRAGRFVDQTQLPRGIAAQFHFTVETLRPRRLLGLL